MEGRNHDEAAPSQGGREITTYERRASMEAASMRQQHDGKLTRRHCGITGRRDGKRPGLPHNFVGLSWKSDNYVEGRLGSN
jgi:hypothetical protein